MKVIKRINWKIKITIIGRAPSRMLKWKITYYNNDVKIWLEFKNL